MGDSVFQSCGRKKKILWGKQGMSASVSCPVGAGVPPKPEQAGAVWVCAGVEKAHVWAWIIKKGQGRGKQAESEFTHHTCGKRRCLATRPMPGHHRLWWQLI